VVTLSPDGSGGAFRCYGRVDRHRRTRETARFAQRKHAAVCRTSRNAGGRRRPALILRVGCRRHEKLSFTSAKFLTFLPKGRGKVEGQSEGLPFFFFLRCSSSVFYVSLHPSMEAYKKKKNGQFVGKVGTLPFLPSSPQKVQLWRTRDKNSFPFVSALRTMS
jgi:hypothetical protein